MDGTLMRNRIILSAEKKLCGEGKSGNGWERVIKDVLVVLLYGRMFNFCRNGMYATLLEGNIIITIKWTCAFAIPLLLSSFGVC